MCPLQTNIAHETLIDANTNIQTETTYCTDTPESLPLVNPLGLIGAPFVPFVPSELMNLRF